MASKVDIIVDAMIKRAYTTDVSNQRIDLLAEKAEIARETLTQTKAGFGSGTIACRLWNELYGLVKEIEKANSAICGTKEERK